MSTGQNLAAEPSISTARAEHAGGAQGSALTEALARSALFYGLPHEALVRLTEVGQQRRFSAGRVVLHQGDPSDSLHVILRGRVRVEYVSPGHPTPLFLR